MTPSNRKFLLIVPFLLMGCGQDSSIDPPQEIIKGYQISGYVRDKLGLPFSNIRVRVDYEFEFIEEGDPPQRFFQVLSPGATVTVVVLDANEKNIRLISSQAVSPGSIEVIWDKRKKDGEFAPSGLYWVHYLIDGVSKHSYPVIVTNAITTQTDSLGYYNIYDIHLPIGYPSVPLYKADNSSFLGYHRIGTRVFLDFLVGNTIRTARVTPKKDQVTRVDVILK